MGKIKNQTQAQKEIHNRAVKIRKLSDEELVKRFDAVMKLACAAGTSVEQLSAENATKTACAAGFSAEQLNTNGIKEFLNDLDAAACAAGVGAEQLRTNGIKESLHDLDAADLRGIGKITIKKISEFAKEKGYI